MRCVQGKIGGSEDTDRSIGREELACEQHKVGLLEQLRRQQPLHELTTDLSCRKCTQRAAECAVHGDDAMRSCGGAKLEEVALVLVGAQQDLVEKAQGLHPRVADKEIVLQEVRSTRAAHLRC